MVKRLVNSSVVSAIAQAAMIFLLPDAFRVRMLRRRTGLLFLIFNIIAS